MWKVTFVFALASTACGASAPKAAETSKTTPKAAAISNEQRCLASFVKHRPAGWTDVGRLVIALEDGRPLSMTAEDTSGRSVETTLAPKSKEAAENAMRELTCRLGGLALVVDAADGGQTATFAVLAPSVADEKADVVALCREPETIPEGADAHQRYRLAVESLDERLTTARWRGWLWDVLEGSAKTQGFERASLRSEKADELHAAALASGITGRCWYEAALRAPHLP
jgi:hypothetical protein